jgi:hypothetical protein
MAIQFPRRFFIMAAATGAILCILWAFAAPWASAFPMRPDHYKVTLFGVRHISDMGPAATQTRCGWHQRLDACAPAIDGEEKYASLARARYFVFAGLLFTLIGIAVLRVRHVGPWAAGPFVAAALAMGAAITLVRSNVPTALAAFAGARVDVNGTGLTAAEIAAGLCFIAAVIAAIPASHHAPDSTANSK